MKSYKILIVVSVLFMLPFMSCKKYLDAKPDKSLQIPATLQDLQALLDNGFTMNQQYGVSYDEASADNYYVPAAQWNDLSQESKDAYIWNNLKYSNYPNDWSNIYNIVNVANTVLDNINQISITPLNKKDWENVKGSALFFRSFAFLEGAFIFCKAYDSTTSGDDAGLVLKLTSDINEKSFRSTVADTYLRIIEDLQTSINMLPDLPQNVFRPSKISVYTLLARTYLSMRKYDSCASYSSLALTIKSDLMNYNNFDTTMYQPFPQFNKEVLFQNVIGNGNYASIDPYYARVDTTLYSSYDNNDLRKKLFFYESSPGYIFNGSYSPYQLYTGITTDEVYLMRAESYAHLNNVTDALQDLNALLVTRWKSGTFKPFVANNSETVLTLILNERRKELIFRGLRWMDIKRLNKEGANITLVRNVNGTIYTLQPNKERFALPLPDDIINLTGIQQNPY